jgi:hypothetical protein
MKFVLALILLLHGIAAAAERPQDFAFGMAIQADGRDALYEIDIPVAVYRGVTRGDLGDLRVFNGQGEVVPHALRAPVVSVEQVGAPVRLPVFPFYGEARGKIDDLNVRIERRADGTIIGIQNQPTSREQKILRGYLLDASGNKFPLRELQLDWQGDSSSFIGKVRVDGSDDLAVWTNLANNAALARLAIDGHQVRRDRVELHPGKFKYLRISWPENQTALESLNVLAEPAPRMVASPRVWQNIEGAPVSGKAGEYSYDLGGYVPADRLRVELPQVNSLAQMQIFFRAATKEDWRWALSAVAYRLRAGETEVTNPEIALPTNSARYWLLRVDQKGGGVGSGVPVLQFGWAPQKLVFAARGAGPFQLAYGSSTVKPAALAIAAIIPGYKTEAEFKVKSAALGAQFTLAGAAQSRVPWDYRKIALWSILILGVGLLAWMAFRLSRQIAKAPTSSEKTDTAK